MTYCVGTVYYNFELVSVLWLELSTSLVKPGHRFYRLPSTDKNKI